MVQIWQKICEHPIVYGGSLALTIVVFALLFVGIPIAARKIPADYFTNPVYLDRGEGEGRGRDFYGWVRYLGRQLVGILLIVLGTVFLQGVLVVILGLVLMEFKQKAGLIRRLVCIGFVWRLLGKIREKRGLPALEKPRVGE